MRKIAYSAKDHAMMHLTRNMAKDGVIPYECRYTRSELPPHWHLGKPSPGDIMLYAKHGHMPCDEVKRRLEKFRKEHVSARISP